MAAVALDSVYKNQCHSYVPSIRKCNFKIILFKMQKLVSNCD